MKEYYTAIKKNEILPLVTTCMDPEGIMLSEISPLYVDSYKAKQKQTDGNRDQRDGYQRGKGGENVKGNIVNSIVRRLHGDRW